ncbi:hypothetical protein LCGC14_1853120 [marine sediment metagenome]|uniref:Uncharacterized protein n=1 Tax=marine sediment metagenome TaxID=412755 RepID=A0A0F9GY13_9ZZZZ
MTQTYKLLGLLDTFKQVKADLLDFQKSYPDLADQFVGTQRIVEQSIAAIEKVNE